LKNSRFFIQKILQRSTVLMQIVSGGMGAIVALVGFWATSKIDLSIGAVLGAMVLTIIGGAWWFVRGDAKRASDRIIEIKAFVNRIVGGDDMNPLSWERRFGLRARGSMDRLLGR